MEDQQTKVRALVVLSWGWRELNGADGCGGRQIYVPDAEVSWVEASITKGHLVNDETVEVVLDADESEEMADKHPAAGTIRKIKVRS